MVNVLDALEPYEKYLRLLYITAIVLVACWLLLPSGGSRSWTAAVSVIPLTWLIGHIRTGRQMDSGTLQRQNRRNARKKVFERN
jgi:hypothetical protein